MEPKQNTQNTNTRNDRTQNFERSGRRPFRRTGGTRPTGAKTSTEGRGATKQVGAGRRNGNRSGGRGGRHQKGRNIANPALTHRMSQVDPKVAGVPALTDPDTVRIIPLGGVEEVGKNMTVVETVDDILIFDAGFQFVSSENDAPGVNYILPNT